jgi:hypothetical protein
MNRFGIFRWIGGGTIALLLPWGYDLTAQAQPAPSAPTVAPVPPPVLPTTQRCRRRLVRGQCLRLRATFFEEERRLRYGFIDFLEAALDGASNSINSRFDPNTLNTDPIIATELDQLPGTLTIDSRDSNRDGFLEGNFSVGNDPRVVIIEVNPDRRSPQTGDITYTLGGSTELNGRYRAGYSQRGNRATGRIEITSDDDPDRVLLIQIPETEIPEDQRSFGNQLSRPATLSIGRPVDR